ncbi:MAG: HAD family hydrolase [Epsilonproteobacteria bacterium]|nr:HAD family hydrolase [Campylobacterota bacterium]
MQKIVIFDMDGTLIDSKKDITLSVNYVREKNHNLPPLSEAFVVEAINKYERNLAKLFYETLTYEERDRVVFEQHYQQQCIQNVYLYDGVYELLEVLKSQGVKMSVATNAPSQFAQMMLASLHVTDMFDLVVGADKVQHSKPDPQMINMILDHYGYDKKCDQAWMVGDNSKDIEAAIDAEIDAIFAAWGFSSYGVHHTVVKDPKEVQRIVL